MNAPPRELAQVNDAPPELAQVNAELADLAANVTTVRERVALSLGPAQDDTDGAYWQELAEWMDWARWEPPDGDYRADTTPDWRQV
jgi:predicted kinase